MEATREQRQAANLRTLRRIRGMSQAEAAEVAGVTKTPYYEYECLGKLPTAKAALRLAEHYHVSLDVIVGRRLIKVSYEVE